jgi:very-short-patch-repair endonuclease
MAIRPLKRVTNQTRRRAIDLRRKSPQPEQILWSILCRRKLGGLKFRRQHPIEPYIVDYYCASAKLVVELDGESHEGRQSYDKDRAQHLCNLGLKVVRVMNDDVLNNLDGVAEFILRKATTSSAEPSPSPSLGGRGIS